MKLSEGLHNLTVKCPECGRLAVIPVGITARLTIDSGNGGKLGPKFKTQAVDHICVDNDVQSSLPFVDADE